MRDCLHVTTPLTASPDQVWRLISQSDRVERWFAWVARTELRSAGEGGLRVIHLKDGSAFDEHITLNDDRTRTYQYFAIAPPLPVEHVLGTQRVVTLEGRACLSWLVTYHAYPGAPGALAAELHALYVAASARIDELAR
jgi:hypothetical protein